ncbi:unnamed protein product, partial [Pleuronectes platessa]
PFIPSSLLLLIPLPAPLPWLIPDRPTANVHQMPPPNPTPSHSLSLLTPLFDTDRWNCYQCWLLRLGPLSPTLHTVYFVFPSLIPYQVKNKSREGVNEWKEMERER